MTTLPRNPAAPASASAITRAVVAHMISAAHSNGTDPLETATARWPRDETTAAVIRATVSPSTIGNSGAVVATSVADFLSDLPQSAGARLIAQSISVPLGRNGELRVPFDATDPDAGLAWVAEAEPIQTSMGAVDAINLSPRKMAVILVASRSLTRNTAAEGLLRLMLARRAAYAFDAALFATSAGSDAAVAGLLYGVSAITGYGGSDTLAIKTDLMALTGAIADAGGSGAVVLAMNPKQAAHLALEYPNLAWPILPSPAIPAGRIVAVDPAGIVFGTDALVDIQATQTALLHMSDTPSEIVAEGGAVADPVRELWQTDGVAMRLILNVGWTAWPGSVAYVTGASW